MYLLFLQTGFAIGITRFALGKLKKVPAYKNIFLLFQEWIMRSHIRFCVNMAVIYPRDNAQNIEPTFRLNPFKKSRCISTYKIGPFTAVLPITA